MSDTDSNTDNEGEFTKLPKSFQAHNANHNQAFMNIATTEQAVKTHTTKNDAVGGDKMATCHLAGVKDKMAPQNVAQANGTISEHPSWNIVDALAIRKATSDAHNMASTNMANNGAQLFKWNVETTDCQMVAPRSAFTGGRSPRQANVYGGAVPSQDGETAARNTTTAKGVANDGNKMTAGTGEKMAAGARDKMAGIYGNKMAASARQKMVPASVTRRSNIGGCYEVRLGSQSVRWLHEGSVIFTTHRTGRCGYPSAPRCVVAVRPSLWRVTLQALLCTALAIFLTYFAIHYMERYLHEDH